MVSFGKADSGGTMYQDPTGDAPSRASEVSATLDRQLTICEGLMARMDVLQQHIDRELRLRSPDTPANVPYEGAPAVRLAVNSVLLWMASALRRRPG